MATTALLLPILLLLAVAAASDDVLRLHSDDAIHCDSWRFAVETNDAGPWRSVPSRCVRHVAEYMTGPRYASDLDAVAASSLALAANVARGGDAKAAWIFDVDETLLSNLPYYTSHHFGEEVFNETAFDEWVEKASAPALPASLRFYEELKTMGFRLVLLTGRSERQRRATEENLATAGYSSWERLILRDASDMGKSAVAYKSEKRAVLESEGYTIYGSSGDQWSDLFGSPLAMRSFKLPNPMYYIS